MQQLVRLVLSFGAHNARVIPAEKVPTDSSFRKLCEANSCGLYGQNWMCPPHAGEIESLMVQLQTYNYALVYQTVSRLEDSYDFEGMIQAKRSFQELALTVKRELPVGPALYLGAGGCQLCEVCGIKTDEPCRHPELAMASLEAYGVNVSQLAGAAGMKYTNGAGTVTYFGAVFFDL